jgi:hypothetical protein
MNSNRATRQPANANEEDAVSFKGISRVLEKS